MVGSSDPPHSPQEPSGGAPPMSIGPALVGGWTGEEDGERDRERPGRGRDRAPGPRTSEAGRIEQAFEAIACLARCIDQLVREVRRGTSAQWKPVQDELNRVRRLAGAGFSPPDAGPDRVATGIAVTALLGPRSKA